MSGVQMGLSVKKKCRGMFNSEANLQKIQVLLKQEMDAYEL